MLLHRRFLILTIALVALTAASAAPRWRSNNALATEGSNRAAAQAPAAARAPQRANSPGKDSVATNSSDAVSIDYPRESWSAASLEVAPVRRAPLTVSVQLTGKIALNEDRLAHVYPLVEGAVDSVHVRLGQRVEKGELLAVIHSREVGQAKLALYEERLRHDFAAAQHRRSQEVASNTTELITALRNQTPIEQIEEMFRDRPMGEYRQQLLSAYVSLYKSNIDFERLESLSEKGAIAGKQLLTAEAARNADRATLQAWLEQISHDLKIATLRTTQEVREAQTRVAVAETNLKILGYNASDLEVIDPAEEGEAISHYPIRAPFDGTVISKDVVRLERAEPSAQILSIADLSTVWVTADVYERHLRLLRNLDGRQLTIRSDAWPDRTFQAEVFYTGEVMDESSRTIAMRAIADNDEGLLKPGMFVHVELPDTDGSEVLQVPASAILEHEGKQFVFLQSSDDSFVRRDVTAGRTSGSSVEIIRGIQAGDRVVVNGGFTLKSRMLSDLLEED